TMRVGLVQTNLPQNNKMGWTFEQRLADMQRFEELTRRAASPIPDSAGNPAKPDVIAWPETMFPGLWLDLQAIAAQRQADLHVDMDRPGGRERVPTTVFADRLLALQVELGVPMVVGAIGVENFRIERGAVGRVVELRQE